MDSRRITLVSGMVLATLAACSAPSDKAETTTAMAAGTLAMPSVTEARTAIEAANTRAMAALMAGDVKGVMANYAASAMVMQQGMPMMNGAAGIEDGMKGMLGTMKMDSASFATTDVTLAGEMAIETGTYRMRTTMKGAKPTIDVGKYLTVWQHQADGSWKIIRDINNSDGMPMRMPAMSAPAKKK